MTAPERKPPVVACSLDAAGQAARVSEWQRLVAEHVRELQESETAVRLVLDDSDTGLAAAASLGQREACCCPFFDVAIELGGDRRVLRLSVPEGASAALHTFVTALRR